MRFVIASIFLAFGINAGSVIVTSAERLNHPGCRDISTGLGDQTNIYVCPDSGQNIFPSSIAVVERNQKIILSAVPVPWGLDRIDQSVRDLDGKYNPSPGIFSGTGRNVNVYVIDTGIDTSHPEFEGRAISLFNHADDDSTVDCSGHGTHVAGIINSKTYGVAKQATVLSVRVFNCLGGATLDWVIAAINSVVAHAKTTGKRSVINMSLSASEDSLALREAVQAATGAGIHVVVAAGK
jgi:subtilisin family serine protease